MGDFENASKTSGEITNVFLTALSNLVLRSGRAELLCVYKDKIGELGAQAETIPGIFSGEAALRYYIRKSCQDRVRPDRYIFVCTDEVIERNDKKSKVKPLTIRNISDAIDEQVALHGASADLGKNKQVIKETLKCLKCMDSTIGNDTVISTYDYVKAIVYYEMRAGFDGCEEEIVQYVEKSTSIELEKKEEIAQEEEESTGNEVKKEAVKKYFLTDKANEDEIQRFIENIFAEFKNCEQLNVSLDLTGGFRLSNLTVLLIAQWFESNWHASLDDIFYAAAIHVGGSGWEYELVNWRESYRRFGIKDFNMDGLSNKLDEKTDMWLHEFIRETNINYFQDSSFKDELSKTRDIVHNLISQLDKQSFSMAKINYLNLCYKALTKTDILEKGSVREYVNTRLDAPYLFISYSHRNIEEVYRDVMSFVEKGDIGFVYDIILELFLGIEWDKVVKDYLERDECKVVLFYMSEYSMASVSVFEEVLKVKELAEAGKKSYIPIQLWRDDKHPNPESFIQYLADEGKLADLLKIYPDAVTVLKAFFSKQTAIPYESDIVRRTGYFDTLMKNLFKKGFFS